MPAYFLFDRKGDDGLFQNEIILQKPSNNSAITGLFDVTINENANSKLCLMSTDLLGTVQFWNAEDKSLVFEDDSFLPIDLLTSCTFNERIAFYMPSKNNSILIYALTSGQLQLLQLLQTLNSPLISSPDAKVTCMTFINNGSQLVVALTSGLCHVIDIESQRIIQTLNGHASPIRAVSISDASNGQLLLTGGEDGCACIFDIKSGCIANNFTACKGAWVTGVQWNPVNDEYFSTGESAAVVKYWDRRSGNSLNCWESATSGQRNSKQPPFIPLSSINPSGDRICIVFPRDSNVYIYKIINS